MKLASDSQEMSEHSIITRLQNEARLVLDKLIPADAEVLLLDYPNNTNVGDSLIWLGEIAYLKSRNLKPRYVCDVNNYNYANIKKILNKNSLILMQGGGNLGTVWEEIQNFRLRVLDDFPNIPIIQLPQTIYFDDQDKVKEMAQAIKRQGNYHLLVRCQRSYEFSKQYFLTYIYLCPDMAFFIGPVSCTKQPVVNQFILSRLDHEKMPISFAASLSENQLNGVQIKDWLTPGRVERILHRVEMHSKWFRSWVDPNNMLLFVLWNLLAEARKRRGVGLLSRGNIVITDRLHAHILSILMNKAHVVVDNSYGKVSGFYKTWTSSYAGAVFVYDLEVIGKVAKELANYLTSQDFTNNPQEAEK